MHKFLEESIGILSVDDIEEPKQELASNDDILAETAELLTSVSLSDKVDSALPAVEQVGAHEQEMDDIAERALKSFEEAFSLGMNCPTTKEAGSILSAAKDLLKTALDAKSTKTQHKLRIIELQMRKMKTDTETGNAAQMGEGLDHRGMVAFIRTMTQSDGVMVEKDDETDK